MDHLNTYLTILAGAEAGYYAMKAIGYSWLKEMAISEPDRDPEGVESTLRLARRGFILPTPLDIVFTGLGMLRLSRNFSRRKMQETDEAPSDLTVLFSQPYSKTPRVLEFVDESHVSDTRPFSLLRTRQYAD